MASLATETRIALAHRVAAANGDQPGLRASLVTGSTALGVADAASDLDVALFYDSVPSVPSLDTARLSMGGERLLFAFGEPAEGSMVQSFLVEGIKTDVAYIALSRWAEDAADVLERFNVESPMQKALSGLMEGTALAGAEVIERLRAEAVYPDGLALAAVNAHLRFYPPWAIREQAADRGDVLYFYEMLTGEVKNLVRTLCAVNRVYHWGETKHSDYLLRSLRVAPERCADSLPNLFRVPMAEACDELDRLIRVVFDIVEVELPQADVQKARDRYATPCGG